MSAGLLDEYRAEVEKIFGEELVSLTLYGSHAAGKGEPGAEIPVLIVVRALRREALSAYRDIAHRYARRGIPAPPIFTESFLRESADVFPLEFLGMMERRRVLSGGDVLAGITVATANLRHQVEFELKGKLLSLRRMYMHTFGGKELAELMRNTVGSIVSVARGLLLLSNREAPQGKQEILDAIETQFGVRLPALREALGARQGGRIPPARAEELLFGYLENVETLCSLVNAYRAEKTE